MMSGQPLSPEAFAERLHVSRETLQRLTVYLAAAPLATCNQSRRPSDARRPLAPSLPGLWPACGARPRRCVELGRSGQRRRLSRHGAGNPGSARDRSDRERWTQSAVSARGGQGNRDVGPGACGAHRAAVWVAGRCHHHTRACAFAAPARASRAVPGVRQRLPFLKGRSSARELTEARVSWHMEAEVFPACPRRRGGFSSCEVSAVRVIVNPRPPQLGRIVAIANQKGGLARPPRR